MNNPRVSDMNKEYIINFLQEYSYYIKNFRDVKPMCPTEFFNNEYLKILEETEEHEAAFKKL